MNLDLELPQRRISPRADYNIPSAQGRQGVSGFGNYRIEKTQNAPTVPSNVQLASFQPDIKEPPAQFTQKIPNADYRNRKRGSVFQKVDINALDFSKVQTYEKSDDQLAEIYPLVKHNFLTKNLEETEIQKLIDAMKPEYFKKGESILKYGDQGNKYYILASGSVKVIVYQKGTSYNDEDLQSKISFTKYMEKGVGFGELALLYNDRRSATIQAAEMCTCYSLESSVFKTVVIGSSIEKRSMRASFLDQIYLFS